MDTMKLLDVVALLEPILEDYLSVCSKSHLFIFGMPYSPAIPNDSFHCKATTHGIQWSSAIQGQQRPSSYRAMLFPENGGSNNGIATRKCE